MRRARSTAWATARLLICAVFMGVQRYTVNLITRVVISALLVAMRVLLVKVVITRTISSTAQIQSVAMVDGSLEMKRI